jgi:flagellar basal body rod protein FlgG
VQLGDHQDSIKWPLSKQGSLKKTGEPNTLAIQQSVMEIKISTKNQDFHVVLVKSGNFNER